MVIFLAGDLWSYHWNQRWANSVLMTEYEYEYYSIFQKWPNTNTNNIRLSKNDRIRIRILSWLKKHPNTNTNIIWHGNFYRIWIRMRIPTPFTSESIIQFPEVDLYSPPHIMDCINIVLLCSCLTFLHCVISNVTSNCLPKWMHLFVFFPQFIF